MVLSEPAVLALAARCAPAVAPSTLTALVQVESGFDPLAIGVNGRRPVRLHPASQDAAEAEAGRLLAAGANIDLGLGQINRANLAALGLTVSAAFEPCRNLAAAGATLLGAYRHEAGAAAAQVALRRALSIYNTGDPDRGFRNGYVARVSTAAGFSIGQGDAAGADRRPTRAPTPKPKLAPTARWDVFGRPEDARFVFPAPPHGDAP